MARFDERSLQWIDIIGRFEARSHPSHVRDALAFISRLKGEGRRFWPDGSTQLIRWEEGCTELWHFLNTLAARRNVDKQDLATAMREFIQAFEHSTERMYQMLYGAVEDPDDDQGVTEVFEWFNLVFRFSTYALLSGWIGDKQDASTIRTTINLTTGEMAQEGERIEMKIPKKYRRSARRI